MFLHQLQYPVIGDHPCTEGVHRYGDRLCHADGVGYLYLAAAGQPCRHKVLCHISGGIGGAPVNLCWVLPRKCAAPVPGGPAVSVHHDLPARQSGVPLGASYHEAPCGVDQVSGVFVHQAFRDHLADDFPDDVLLDGVMPDLREVLRGHYHGIHPYRPAVLIFHRHLRLPVRPQVRDIPVLPCLGKLPCEGMGQIDRHGHQLVRFVRGIPEYHPLVAGPKLLLLAPPDLQRPADTLGNVR